MMEEAQIKVSADSDGNPLNGGRYYSLHLPPGIPAQDFWSVLVYDSLTGLIIAVDQAWPSVYSTNKKLQVNQDGSVNIHFGPGTPAGTENNWIQTIPQKTWFMILHLYNPMESWFDKTWVPGLIYPQS